MPYVEQAKQYILEGKSFRAFETECNVPADQSLEAWAKAAAAIIIAKEEAWAKEDNEINNDQEEEFTVTWKIDITADGAEESALRALQVMRDPNSEATHFEVTKKGGDSEQDVVMIEVQL